MCEVYANLVWYGNSLMNKTNMIPALLEIIVWSDVSEDPRTLVLGKAFPAALIIMLRVASFLYSIHSFKDF